MYVKLEGDAYRSMSVMHVGHTDRRTDELVRTSTRFRNKNKTVLFYLS